jgi:hypothetical protein
MSILARGKEPSPRQARIIMENLLFIPICFVKTNVMLKEFILRNLKVAKTFLKNF